jgi:hypothetical protein
VASPRPVLTLRADDPDLPDRLARLCTAAGRPPRVVPVTDALAPTARSIERRMTVRTDESEGDAVVAVAPAGRRQEQLAAVAGVLPPSSMLIAVVLA